MVCKFECLPFLIHPEWMTKKGGLFAQRAYNLLNEIFTWIMVHTDTKKIFQFWMSSDMDAFLWKCIILVCRFWTSVASWTCCSLAYSKSRSMYYVEGEQNESEMYCAHSSHFEPNAHRECHFRNECDAEIVIMMFMEFMASKRKFRNRQDFHIFVGLYASSLCMCVWCSSINVLYVRYNRIPNIFRLLVMN